MSLAETIRSAGTPCVDPLPEPIEADPGFREENNTPVGIRAQHARAALTGGRLERFASDGQSAVVSLAAQEIDADRPYTMLVLASSIQEAFRGTWIAHAWRIYDVAPGQQPSDLLAVLLERFGEPVTVAEAGGVFIARQVVHGAHDGDILRVDGPAKHVQTHAMIQPKSGGVTEVAWAFAIDTDRYEAAARHGR